MKKFLWVSLCAFLVWFIGIWTSPPARAASQKWLRYTNARFGYSVEFPDLFSMRRQSENGDGMWLESKDKKYSLILSGGYNILMQDGRAMLESRKVQGVLKKESGAEWYRLVWCENGQTVHEYGIMDDDNWALFTFSYPRTRDFKTMIERMERNLRFGGNNSILG